MPRKRQTAMERLIAEVDAMDLSQAQATVDVLEIMVRRRCPPVIPPMTPARRKRGPNKTKRLPAQTGLGDNDDA